MSKVFIPEGYCAPLSVYELQRAIEFIKSNFQTNLSNALNLRRVSAPLFVEEASGLNDNLNGYERPVSFDIPDVHAEAQVVHSLAKWKRLALKRYQFNVGKGLFTDMNAIRRDEEVDNLHSVYVDQWDWEKVIAREDRNTDYLKRTVRDIVGAVCETNDALGVAFPSLHTKLDREVFFITTQELEDMYPDKTPKERENPNILGNSRKKRIAAGSGTSVMEVNRLLKQYDTMLQLFKQMNGPGGKKMKRMAKRGGFPGMGGMGGMGFPGM